MAKGARKKRLANCRLLPARLPVVHRQGRPKPAQALLGLELKFSLDERRVDIYDDSGDGEDRFKIVGRVKGILAVVVIHTERDEAIRHISARKASKNEERKYYAQY